MISFFSDALGACCAWLPVVAIARARPAEIAKTDACVMIFFFSTKTLVDQM
jgi:hypothetical protein